VNEPPIGEQVDSSRASTFGRARLRPPTGARVELALPWLAAVILRPLILLCESKSDRKSTKMARGYRHRTARCLRAGAERHWSSGSLGLSLGRPLCVANLPR